MSCEGSNAPLPVGLRFTRIDQESETTFLLFCGDDLLASLSVFGDGATELHVFGAPETINENADFFA